MNFKSIMSSFYLKNYHTFIIFGCSVIISLNFMIPDEIINNLEYRRNFSTTEPLLVYLFSLFFLYSLFGYIKSFLCNKIKIRNNNIQESCRFFLLKTAVISKILFYLTSFILLYYQGFDLPKIFFYGFMDLFYLVFISSAFFFAMYSFCDFKMSNNKNIKQEHWIDMYLKPDQLESRKTVEQHNKIVSVFFKDFILDERDNSVLFKKYKLKLNAFREYLTLNNLKINDLKKEDFLIISMLGV
jgi:hypothetical protein